MIIMIAELVKGGSSVDDRSTDADEQGSQYLSGLQAHISTIPTASIVKSDEYLKIRGLI